MSEGVGIHPFRGEIGKKYVETCWNTSKDAKICQEVAKYVKRCVGEKAPYSV